MTSSPAMPRSPSMPAPESPRPGDVVKLRGMGQRVVWSVDRVDGGRVELSRTIPTPWQPVESQVVTLDTDIARVYLVHPTREQSGRRARVRDWRDEVGQVVAPGMMASTGQPETPLDILSPRYALTSAASMLPGVPRRLRSIVQTMLIARELTQGWRQVEDLAARLDIGISSRTIYRVLVSMQAAGIVLHREQRGQEVYWRLAERDLLRWLQHPG